MTCENMAFHDHLQGDRKVAATARKGGKRDRRCSERRGPCDGTGIHLATWAMPRYHCEEATSAPTDGLL